MAKRRSIFGNGRMFILCTFLVGVSQKFIPGNGLYVWYGLFFVRNNHLGGILLTIEKRICESEANILLIVSSQCVLICTMETFGSLL